MASHCWHVLPYSTVQQRSPQLVYVCCNCQKHTRLDTINTLPEPGKHGKFKPPVAFTELPSDECHPVG